MSEIDRSTVKKSFHSNAENYDSIAVVQKRVINQLLQQLTKIRQPDRILDIGCGTGGLLEETGKMMTDSQITGLDLAFGMTMIGKQRLRSRSNAGFICGDAEQLPFCNGSFDLVISTSAYQWINPLQPAFCEVKRVLKPGGRFIFALFGEKTLFELKESYRQALTEHDSPMPDRTHRFTGGEEVLSALVQSGFTGSNIREGMEIELHDSVPALLRSLREIGASNASATTGKGLSGRKVMQKMMDIYRRGYSDCGKIRASYHVIFGSAELD